MTNLKHTKRPRVKVENVPSPSAMTTSAISSSRITVLDWNSFLDSLSKLTLVDNRFLQLPPTAAAAASFPSNIYVRDSYIAMFGTIKYEVSHHGSYRLALTGNPGIGKTYFVFYLLIRSGV